MKTAVSCALAVVLAGIVFLGKFSFSYGNLLVHPSINQAIVFHCEENAGDIFPSNYALNISTNTETYKGPAVINPGFFEASTSEGEMEYRPLKWIEHGGFSADEPELAAAVRHFYDPVALIGGRKYLTNRGTDWEGIYSNPGIDAIEWALGDTQKGSANKWSLAKGKEYLKNVLELPESAGKERNLARALRCLGEVLHNAGDMSCPAHVRNDSHAAPVGYTLGFMLGSPDSTEELFYPHWATLFRDNSPDPGLKSFFASATSIRAILEKLAEFTNWNFFSNETINGRAIWPKNVEDIYRAPLLEDLEYDSSDYTYYKTFADGSPNGKRVKMCKDKRYFAFRGYPYIDQDCVRSQASVLIPNIIHAGRNIIRLFIPRLTVELTEVGSDGSIKGRVTHVPSDEYKDIIFYSGPVSVFDAMSNGKLGTVHCNTGDFSGVISGLNIVGAIYAKIDLGGGITVKSNVTTVTIQTGLQLYQYFDSNGQLRYEYTYYVKDGKWINHGLYTYYWYSGKPWYQYTYKDGVLEGTSKGWYTDTGLLNYQEEYKDDKLNGTRTVYYNNYNENISIIKILEEWKDGVLISSQSFWPDGTPMIPA